MIILNEGYDSEAEKRKLIDETKGLTIDVYIPKTEKEEDALQMLARRIEKLIP